MAATTRGDWRRDLRTFTAGAGCGFLGGALLVGFLLWHYNLIDRQALRSPHDVGPVASVPADPKPAGTVGTTGGAPADAPPPAPIPAPAPAPAPAPVESTVDVPSVGPVPSSPGELKDRDLEIPVEGITASQLRRDYSQRRGEFRVHEALDILAPTGTPVRAVEDGTIARLFLSKPGGITVYQFDPTTTYAYYYAHLDRYADGLKEGATVRKGQLLGYVGTSGNAPKDTPHLHFAIFRLTDAKHWWEGTPIDPYDVLR